MKNSVKAACLSAAILLAGQAAFAQIIVDLDVLTEDFIPKDTVASQPKTEEAAPVPLKVPAQTTPAAATKGTTKPKPPVKPVAKKAKPAKKSAPAAAKKEQKPVEKYQIKETARKDEHDKLKPRANPVPKVKILATEDTSAPSETDQPTETAQPVISKHFLEQERLKEEKAQETVQKQETPVVAETKVPESTETTAAPAAEKPVIEEKTAEQAPKTLLSSAREAERKKAAAKQQAQQKASPSLSVFETKASETQTERSARLAAEIGTQTATHQALEHGRELYQSLIFAPDSEELNADMQSALDDVVALMKKNRSMRLSLYSYASSDLGKDRRIGLRRALVIRSYLSQRGIRGLRVEIRSLGHTGGDKYPDRTDILTDNI